MDGHYFYGEADPCRVIVEKGHRENHSALVGCQQRSRMTLSCVLDRSRLERAVKPQVLFCEWARVGYQRYKVTIVLEIQR